MNRSMAWEYMYKSAFRGCGGGYIYDRLKVGPNEKRMRERSENERRRGQQRRVEVESRVEARREETGGRGRWADLVLSQIHYHYADPIDSSKDQEQEPILASRTNLPLFIPYIILHMSRVARTGLPLLLVPSLTPQLPLVVHHGLTTLLLLLLLLIGHDSSLGRLLLLLLKDVSLSDRLTTTAVLVRLMSGLGSGLNRPVKEVIVLESFSDKQVSEQLA